MALILRSIDYDRAQTFVSGITLNLGYLTSGGPLVEFSAEAVAAHHAAQAEDEYELHSCDDGYAGHEGEDLLFGKAIEVDPDRAFTALVARILAEVMLKAAGPVKSYWPIEHVALDCAEAMTHALAWAASNAGIRNLGSSSAA